MKQIVIAGGHPLKGTIHISGAKNSAVALLPASLLCSGIVTIDNVPNISDIEAIKEILIYLGAKIEHRENSITIDSRMVENKIIPEVLAKKLRASYYFMGALLGRFSKSEMSFPGGCSIGARPIDLHLKGFEDLGSTVTSNGNQYLVEAKHLEGTDLHVKYSVGATVNLLLASVLATGITIIHEAAREPEITNVVELLQAMGAKIDGKGTDTLIINGVKSLHDANIKVIPDRIEAGTYIIAGALCGDNLVIENIIPEHLESLIKKLQEMQANIEVKEHSILISKKDSKLIPISIKTEVYPGFPTDLQQPMTTLLTTTNGISKMEETIYENRFKHVDYLNKMGASITIDNRSLIIDAPTSFHGDNVIATDLRAGASLILAGLLADGTTTITEVDHILRGYENIIDKLSSVGAKIKLEEI